GASDVGLQNLCEGHLVDVEKGVGRLRLGPALASSRNAQIRLTSQGGQQHRGTPIESHVAQVHSSHFFVSPRRNHEVSPLTRVPFCSNYSCHDRLSHQTCLDPFWLAGYNEAFGLG